MQAGVINNIGISIWKLDEDGTHALSLEDQTRMIEKASTSGERLLFDTIDACGRVVGNYGVNMTGKRMTWFSYTKMRDDSAVYKVEIRHPLIAMWKLAVANSFPVLHSDVR